MQEKRAVEISNYGRCYKWYNIAVHWGMCGDHMIMFGKSASLATYVRSICIFAALLGLALVPHMAYGATVSGDITVAGGKKLKNLIVFLAPANAKAAKAMADVIVTQRDRVFKPGRIVIVAGGKVIFHNDE